MGNETNYSDYANSMAYSSYQQYVQNQQQHQQVTDPLQGNGFSLVNPGASPVEKTQNKVNNQSSFNNFFNDSSIFTKYKDDPFASQLFATKPWEKFSVTQSGSQQDAAAKTNSNHSQNEGISFTI